MAQLTCFRRASASGHVYKCVTLVKSLAILPPLYAATLPRATAAVFYHTLFRFSDSDSDS